MQGLSQARFQGHRPHMARAATLRHPLQGGAFGWLQASVGLQPCRLIVHPQLLSTSSRLLPPRTSLQLCYALPFRKPMSLAPYSIDYLFSSIIKGVDAAAFCGHVLVSLCLFLFPLHRLSLRHFALSTDPLGRRRGRSSTPSSHLHHQALLGSRIARSIRETLSGSGRPPTVHLNWARRRTFQSSDKLCVGHGH